MATQNAKIDPFAKVRTSAPSKGPAKEAPVEAPEGIAAHIDFFRAAQEQMKHFEGEMTVHKDPVTDYCRLEFAKRAMTGKVESSMKVAGAETQVTFISADAGAGLTEEDVAAVAAEFGGGDKGAEIAAKLIKTDYGSIRFDAEVLEANYDVVVEALQTLPPDILARLLKPGLLKTTEGAYQVAKAHAKNAEQLARAAKLLKLKSYIK